MPEKQQIMKISLPVSCETYNCRKKVAWAIGRPDGPRQLWNYYCDDCIRDVLDNIPPELLPTTEIDNIEAKRDLFFVILEDLLQVNDDEFQDTLLEDIVMALGIDLEADETEREQQANELTCEYCGKECKNLAGLQAHKRTCKAKEG